MHVVARSLPQTPRSATAVAAPLVDNPFAPDLFATGAAGFATVNGMVLLTLESARYDHSHEPATLERVVTGRVALTVPAAQRLVMALNDFLEQQGLSPSDALAGGALRQ